MATPTKKVFSTVEAAELVKADKAHHMHGYHVFDEHAEQGSLNIVAGDGAYIYDTQGNRFLDAVGGMWCTNIGLGREEMALAIADQVPATGVFQPVFRHVEQRGDSAVRKTRQPRPRRPRPCVPDHGRFHGGGHGVPADPVLPELPRQAAKETHHRALQRLSRLDHLDHVDRQQGRRPGAGVRLRQPADPSRVQPQPVPRPGRHGRSAVPRVPGQGVRRQDPVDRRGQGRRLFRRADHGLGRGDHSAQGLSQAHVGGVPALRHPVSLPTKWSLRSGAWASFSPPWTYSMCNPTSSPPPRA